MNPPHHRNCTYILPGRLRHDAPAKWMRERTHGCWCSSWKLLPDGTWRVWRRGRWLRPKAGEVRKSKRNPYE